MGEYVSVSQTRMRDSGSGQIGKLRFQLNPDHEKSKEEVVYAQGGDLLTPVFWRGKGFIYSNLIATLKTSAAPTQRH